MRSAHLRLLEWFCIILLSHVLGYWHVKEKWQDLLSLVWDVIIKHTAFHTGLVIANIETANHKNNNDFECMHILTSRVDWFKSVIFESWFNSNNKDRALGLNCKSQFFASSFYSKLSHNLSLWSPGFLEFLVWKLWPEHNKNLIIK